MGYQRAKKVRALRDQVIRGGGGGRDRRFASHWAPPLTVNSPPSLKVNLVVTPDMNIDDSFFHTLLQVRAARARLSIPSALTPDQYLSARSALTPPHPTSQPSPLTSISRPVQP